MNYEGTSAFTISGPPSFSGSRDLNGFQEAGPSGDPDLANAIGFRFEADRSIVEDVVWILVQLSSLGYSGPGTYGCGLEVLEPGQSISALCNVVLLHFPRFDEKGAAWTFPPFDPASPSLRPCTLVVRNDNEDVFDGSLDCSGLVFWGDSSLYATEHPDMEYALDFSGTWSFPERQIFTLIE